MRKVLVDASLGECRSTLPVFRDDYRLNLALTKSANRTVTNSTIASTAHCEGSMSDDDEIDPPLTNGRRSHAMDEAFCARMRKAIEAGLESAPIGVITTPGTSNPKYIPAEMVRFSQGSEF